MDSPVSESPPVSAIESSRSDRHPQRLSALYQYHNAPEVAPAHGLEWDETSNYPHSDKFPVIRESPLHRYRYTSKHAFDTASNRPPRIIFGMKVKTFLVVALIMILVVTGAAVGGAVGGKHIHQGTTSTLGSVPPSSPNIASPSPTHTTSTTFSAPVPTYTPLSDCPQSNDTTYTSDYRTDLKNPSSPKQVFTKYCDFTASTSFASRTSEAFVYSFSDCIEVCASSNTFEGEGSCTIAMYLPAQGRPSNCWLAAVDSLKESSLRPSNGMDVALLKSPS